MKTIHWGMVGCGDVTEKKSGPGFYKACNSVLYGVTNRTRSKAEDYAVRHRVTKVYDNIDEMLSDPKIDAIYIATPPGFHKEHAIKCAEANKPCYIEKPVALCYEDHMEIVKAFEKTGAKAFTAYYRRRLPRFLKVSELLEQGAIGEVRFVHISYYRPAYENEKAGKDWHIEPDISGGGIFMDIAVHQLDILDFLFGRINEVKSLFTNQAHYYKPEDMLNVCFSFENGIQGSGDWCFAAGTEKDVIEIIGSRGRISFECFGTGAIIHENISENGFTVRELPVETPEHIQQNLIQSIVDELNGEDICPSTLYTAARTAWVCDKIYGKM